jgi:predicted transcriptional regulator
MDIAETKLELVKQILNTNDKELINHLLAIFSTHKEYKFEELPPKIQASVKRGLKQSKEGNTIPHAEVMKKYKKWLKK